MALQRKCIDGLVHRVLKVRNSQIAHKINWVGFFNEKFLSVIYGQTTVTLSLYELSLKRLNS